MKNAMEMVSVGGHFLGVGPGNNFPGHGFFQFSPELYWRIFSEENGFAVEEVTVCETRRNAPSYRIEDPAINGRRIELTNSRPLYVMVRARRLQVAEIFKTTPQQPYYAAAWSSHSGNGTRPGADGLRGWAQRSLPESVKRFARPFAPRVRPLRFSGLKRLKSHSETKAPAWPKLQDCFTMLLKMADDCAITEIARNNTPRRA